MAVNSLPSRVRQLKLSRKLNSSSSRLFSKNSLKESCSAFLERNHYLEIASFFIDKEGVVRVGGRINKAEIPSNQRNPLILPAGHHISTLLVQHHHDAVKHQGRHFTAGAVRAAGLWIIGGKRLISSVIHKCVKCRKLRGGQMFQQMADLPADRLQPGPPFTSVGVDTFGPWQIVTRKQEVVRPIVSGGQCYSPVLPLAPSTSKS